MKDDTVKYKGNAYQIGKYYLFSDGGEYWDYNILKNIDMVSEFPFVNVVGVRYSLIKEVHASKDLGTITPAPIKLVDGSAYMFDYKDIQNRCGVYDEYHSRFIHAKGYTLVFFCTNIRRMIVELDP